MIAASRELVAPLDDVWNLVAEPYHLPDWWPAYEGVQPDRRGLREQARWQVSRSRRPGFLRRPGGEGTIVILTVDEGRELRWLDVSQRLEAGIELRGEGAARTRATVFVAGPWWRLLLEGARPLPDGALARLHALCQTAAAL